MPFRRNLIRRKKISNHELPSTQKKRAKGAKKKKNNNNILLHEPRVGIDPILKNVVRSVAPKPRMVPDLVVPPEMRRAAAQVPHETVRVQVGVGVHRVAGGAPAPGGVPDHQPGLAQDPVEHLQRRGLGVVDGVAAVPTRSHVFEESAGELAFEFAEDAAGLVLEVGAVVHDGWR